ncbi:MAG: ribonuclease G [Gammaproteobacteria bacterium]|nr:ribonuclease G [Gammaproteobacteria bacterium]
MSAEILINVTPQETRVAVIENGIPQEVFVERANRRGLVGNIYNGVVRRVLPGMQAAFVDIGLERAAFLHASDITSSQSSSDTAARAASSAEGEQTGILPPVAARAEDTHHESISELLREGEAVIVQVVKDPLGTKGARLTTHISIPSCYLVFVPGADSVGISQRIEDEEERERLRALVTELAEAQVASDQPTPEGCYIVRTAAEGADESKLRADLQFLQQLWRSIGDAGAHAGAPQLIHEDLPLVIRTLRELVGTEIEKVRIDSRETYRKVLDFTEEFTPNLVAAIEHYPGERPIFDLYSVEDEIQRALERKVPLKSGGHLVIDQTEAMTTIDVNTGAYVGRRNLEETIFKTNLEAAQAIARQLRLRNLGGIIIIDFIDMTSEEHKRQVLRALEKSLEKDQTKTQLGEVSSLGLVQMTRKRTRESLGHILCDPCPHCTGVGYVKTAETVCYEIFREILREARQYEPKKLLVLASQDVIDRLVDEESANLAELEAFIGRPIRLQTEAMYTQSQYDVVLL